MKTFERRLPVLTSPLRKTLNTQFHTAKHRLEAAQASGGTSGGPARQMALRLLKEQGASGRLLEFGAGSCTLPKRLVAQGFSGTITCADILPKPENLPHGLDWVAADLNNPLAIADASFDAVVCVEVIEHLENPRAVFREISRLLVADGLLVLTTPNQRSLRSLCGLLFGGHFALFLGANYPAHISALMEMDFERICEETGFQKPCFYYSGEGRIPKLTSVSWQQISLGILGGRLFSDNLALVTRKGS